MPYEKPKEDEAAELKELTEIEQQAPSAVKAVQAVTPTNPAATIFLDKTNDYGLSDLNAVAMNAVDLNFDGRTDVVLLQNYYSRPKFYIFNAKKNKFELWAHDPLPGDFKASYLLFYDMNKDKVPDLISGVLNQRSEVGQVPLKYYVGKIEKGLLTFTEDPTALNLPAEPTSSVTVLDFDLDGWPDLFISNWFENKNGLHFPVADRFLRNVKGKFAESTALLKDEAIKASSALYPPNARPTYGASTCDVDQNGYPDILTVSSAGHSNKMWINSLEATTGERYFKDIAPVTNYGSDANGSLVPTGGGRSFFSACTDYNDDGLMDIFLGELSHAYDNEAVDRSSILTGSKETYPPYFLRTEYVSDVTSEAWNQGDRRGVWFDYNFDGQIDIIVDNSGFPPFSRLVLYQQEENHAFEDVAGKVGIDIVNPASTIVLDVNNDGRPDILTSQNNIRQASIAQRLYLFENQTPLAGKRIIKVHLSGNKSNTHALGAMVMLYTRKGKKRTVQKRWTEYSQGGLPSQNESGILFGVGSGVEALGVKVKWPYVEKKGQNSGAVIEHLYSLKDFPKKTFIQVTVCENGKILPGKVSCPI